jgi:phage baseplate assembly protein W
MQRRDYAFPFRIDGSSSQGALALTYAAHVEQMIQQVLLTSPGERADMPTFGCGVRRLLFAPNSPSLAATAQIIVLQSLTKWLSTVIDVQQVAVLTPDDVGDDSQIIIQVRYTLIDTRTDNTVEVLVQ